MRSRSACRLCLVALLAVVALSLGSTVEAQTVTGVIHGVVKDQTDSAVPGVEIELVNDETGLVRTTLSDDVGRYNVPALPPGVYTITATMPGFKQYERTGVQVTVSERVRVDITLMVGEISEQVTVTGGAVMVDTRSAEISSLVDDDRITDLPLAGRNVIGLARILPGITNVNAPDIQSGARGGPSLSSHGSRSNQNFFTLNGSYFNHPSRNTGMNPPPPDAVREFRIKTNNFSAAEGRNAGSVVTVVTRSGTNDFHGTGWWFHRNDNLNARNFFEGEQPERKRNQFGVAAGGPILPDRIFVFGSYEGFRERAGASEVAAFPPTADERAGDFSHLDTQLVNPFTGEAFEGNQISPDLFDPVSVNIMDGFLPLPNSPDGRFISINPSSEDNNLFMLRNDFNLSAAHTVFWHYYTSEFSQPPGIAGNIPGWMDTDSGTSFHNVAASHTWTMSPTVVNEASFGFIVSDQFTENLTSRSNSEIGLDFPDYTPYGATRFNVSGRVSLQSISQLDFEADSYSFTDGLSWTTGDHIFKFGGAYSRLTFFQAWLAPPQFNFNGARSGDPMADFMLGAWRDNGFGFGRRRNDTIQPWFWSFYAQDEWRVHPRFTLTLGMRYELPSPWNDQRDVGISTVVFDAIEGGQVTSAPVAEGVPAGFLFANFDLPAGLLEADTNNFAPRLGFAWDVYGDGRMSIRGGAGIFYDTANADTLAQVNPPFGSSFQIVNGRLGQPCAGVDCDTLPPSEILPDAESFDWEASFPFTSLNTDLSNRNTYFYHWNLGISRQLTEDLAVSADYIGKIGRKMLAFVPLNPAIFVPGVDENGNPNSTLENVQDRALTVQRFGEAGRPFGTFYNLQLASMFDSWYHGLDLQVNKRLSNGFSILGSYTWSKAIDQNSTSSLGGDSPNPFDMKKAEQGLADFHRAHVLRVSGLYQPFFGSDYSGLAGQVIGGWQLSPILRLSTGSPMEFFSGEDRGLVGFGGQHPSVSGNPELDHGTNQSKLSEYFNTDLFFFPELGAFGNAGKGLLTGPGDVVFDLALLKTFPIGMILSEESRIQFRAEFFNMFNNTNFNNPTTNLSSSRFGQITGAGGAREIQFGLKFIW